MNKYMIRFTGAQVVGIMPVHNGSEILGTPQMLVTTLERAKIMLDAIGCDTKLLDEYQEPESETIISN